MSALQTGSVVLLLAYLFTLPASWAAGSPQLDALIKSRMDIVGAKPAYMPPVAIEDLVSLSPLCAELLRNQRISELNPKFGSWLSSMRSSGILDNPEFNILIDAKSFHHYCWGELAQNRYYREVNAQKRKDLAQYAASSYKYVIDHPEYLPGDWPYMPKMYVAFGNAVLLTKENARATGAFLTAIRLDPRTITAYSALADLYVSEGAKAKALDLVKEGLRYDPKSKAMQRRYNELGGKLPYPEPYPPPPQKVESAPAVTVPSGTKDGGAAAPTPDKGSPKAQSGDQPDTAEKPAPIGTKDNPYCRFCAE